MNLTSAFMRLLNRFIPKAIRNKPKVTREELIRAQAMVAILIGSIIMPLLLLAAYIILQIITRNDFSKDIVILIGVEVLLVREHIYFQSYGNFRVTAGIYSVQFLIIAIVATALSGALYSPLTALLITSPMIAFMTMSYRAALVHIAAAFLTITVLLMMQANELQLPNFGRMENYPYTLAIIWGLALAIFMLFLIVFEELVHSKVGSSPT